MKIWEIMKEENVGKKYVDSNCNEWEVYKIRLINGDYYDLRDCSDNDLSKEYYLSSILELDFEEVVDWSKVPVDTKILVKNSNCDLWHRRYFSKFENGKVHAFDNGGDSWSNEGEATWEYAKLYKEGDR